MKRTVWLFVMLFVVTLCGCSAMGGSETTVYVITHSADAEVTKLPSETIAGTEPETTAAPETAAVPETTADADTSAETESAEEAAQLTYVLNTNTKKFHLPACGSVDTIKEKNREDFTGDRAELIGRGYAACKRCNP